MLMVDRSLSPSTTFAGWGRFRLEREGQTWTQGRAKFGSRLGSRVQGIKVPASHRALVDAGALE
jgi:hypothetical protein